MAATQSLYYLIPHRTCFKERNQDVSRLKQTEENPPENCAVLHLLMQRLDFATQNELAATGSCAAG